MCFTIISKNMFWALDMSVWKNIFEKLDIVIIQKFKFQKMNIKMHDGSTLKHFIWIVWIVWIGKYVINKLVRIVKFTLGITIYDLFNMIHTLKNLSHCQNA